MKTKEFDCVDMQHEGGRRIIEATKDMTREELVAYWGERNRAAREMQAAFRTGHGAAR